MAPLVSVLIPAFRAGATLRACVDSVLQGGLAIGEVEILVESDDGDTYPAVAALPSVRLAVGGGVASGVGPARNRALARARGSFITYIDADDLLAPGWLAALLPLAKGEGAAASALTVREGGEDILHLWHDQPRLTFGDLAKTGASARGLFHRALCPPFADALAQDILHMAQVMAAQGGSLPLSPRPYILQVTAQSVSGAEDFSARVHQAYLAHIATMSDQPEAVHLFHAKIALNAEYGGKGAGQSYYRFIAGRQRL